MDRSSSVLIHANPNLHNQKLYAGYLKSGFERLGFSPYINSDFDADIHVCIGPHYALNRCFGKKTIYIDRCLWGNDLENVTIGWLRPDGGMIYPYSSPDDRTKPELKPWKSGEVQKVLFLLDYSTYPTAYNLAKEIYSSVKLRPHPAARQSSPLPALPELADELKAHDLAIGYRTSALFTAAIEGLPVISLDMRSSVWDIAGHDLAEIRRPDRTQWLNNMSYAQWSGKEIESGEALEYVCNTGNRASS